MKNLILTITMTACFILCTQSAFAGTRVSINIGVIPAVLYGPDYAEPEPRVVYVEPEPEYIWVEGHYGDAYPRYWVPGHWMRQERHRVDYRNDRPDYRRGYQDRDRGDGRWSHGDNDNGRGNRYDNNNDQSRSHVSDDRGRGHYDSGSSGHGQYDRGQTQVQNPFRTSQRQDGPGSGNWMKNLNDRVIKKQVRQQY